MPSASGGSKVICGEKMTHHGEHGGHGEWYFLCDLCALCGEKSTPRRTRRTRRVGIFSVISVTSVVKKLTTENTERTDFLCDLCALCGEKKPAYLISCPYLYFPNNISTFITYWLHLEYRSFQAMVTLTATLAGLLNNNL